MYASEPTVNVPPVKLSIPRPGELLATVAVTLMLALSVMDLLPILKAVPEPLIVRVVPVASGGAGRWPWSGCDGGMPVGGAPKTGTAIASASTSAITVPNSAIFRIFLPQAIAYPGV